jgi:hypothetical protein
MAVVLMVAVMGVAYLSFWGLHDVAKEVEKQGNRSNSARRELVQNGFPVMANTLGNTR